MPKLERALLTKYLRPQWPRVLALGLVLFAGVGLQLANPLIVGEFIDRARAGAPPGDLVRIALVFSVVAVLTQAATVLDTFVAQDLGWRVTNRLRAELTAHVLDLDSSFHAEHSAGELLERIDGDVGSMAGLFSRFVVYVVGNAAFLIGVVVMLLLADLRVGAVLALVAVGAFLYLTRGGGFVGKRSKGARRAAAALSGYVEERLGALPDVKTSGADAYVMRRLHERLADRFHRGLSVVTAGSVFNTGLGTIFLLGSIASLALSAILLRSGAITLGTVYLIFRYTGMLRMPLDRLSRQMNSFQQAAGSIARVRELFATRSSIVDGRGDRLPDGALSVELDAVDFAYDSEPVLRDVSLYVAPGQSLGLLGRTGSGKTTISRLIFRLHDATSGAVRIGGTDVRDAALAELRARIGLVTQDVQLFAGTLRDNVTMFDRSVPDERLRETFSDLGLDPWLRRSPAGLDTALGSDGGGLSAGEAQLVALARVFLKDPGLVVLDEASSRLDPATERLLERAVTTLLAGRTAIVIAHRLTTVERADAIVILEEGRVAEAGPRRELVSDATSRYSSLLRTGMAEELV